MKTLWHGSRFEFAELKSPLQSGNIRPSEENRRCHRDKVFLSADVSLAIQYAREHAGDGGYLYEVAVTDSECLLDSRLKNGRRKTVKSNPAIRVASPENCRIVAVWRTQNLGRNRGYRIYQD